MASISAGLLPLAVGWISPLAVVILLVKDEMAHPAQDLSFEVPMRASTLLASASAGVVGGCTVSAIVLPYLRTRSR